MGRVKNEALLGGLHMSLVWISKPVVSLIEEEATLLMVTYYCICECLCRVAVSTHLCVICCHFCCPLSLFQFYLDYRTLPYLIGPQERGSRKKKKGFLPCTKNPNTFLTLWFLNGNWVKNQRILVQWNPVPTATSVIQSPHYYGQFFLAWQNGHTFSDKKTLVNAVTC